MTRLSLIVFTFALAAVPALACSCAGGKGGCEAPSADVIVLARVVSLQTVVTRPPIVGNVFVTLEVLERFRGNASDRLVVRTRVDSCLYPFESGHEYLVFATEYQGALTVNICSATQPARAAASRIRQLRAMREGTALPSLFGSVLAFPREQGEGNEEDVRPMPGLTVTAQSGEQEHHARTGPDGVYEFQGLPAGEYQVRVEEPPGGVALWSGGAQRFRTYAGPGARCAVNFQVPEQAVSGR